MLELLAARTQLALGIGAHSAIAATAWVSALLALGASRSSRETVRASADDWLLRTRYLGDLGLLSGTLIWGAIALCWSPVLTLGGPTLWVPVVGSVTVAVLRAVVLRKQLDVRTAAALSAVLASTSGALALCALAWLAVPVGAVVGPDGTLQAGWFDALGSSTAWVRVTHVGLAALAFGGLLLSTGAARREAASVPGGAEARRRALGLALFALTLQPAVGVYAGRLAAEHQPAKLATMLAQWKTHDNAAMRVFDWPYEYGGYSRGGVVIPGLSGRLFGQGPELRVMGVSETPSESRPFVAVMHMLTHVMVIGGALTWLFTLGAVLRPGRGRVLQALAVVLVVPTWWAGWLVGEFGRQPWAIRGFLRIGEGLRVPVGVAPVLLLVGAASVVLLVLGAVRCRRIGDLPRA